MSATEMGVLNFVRKGFAAQKAADEVINDFHARQTPRVEAEHEPGQAVARSTERTNRTPNDSTFMETQPGAAAGDPIHHSSTAAAPGASNGTKTGALNPTRFLNRTECRNFLLQFAAQNRAHKFSRVSEETLRDINEAVRSVMISKVKALPSKGKTI
jgi:hypothetical protein